MRDVFRRPMSGPIISETEVRVNRRFSFRLRRIGLKFDSVDITVLVSSRSIFDIRFPNIVSLDVLTRMWRCYSSGVFDGNGITRLRQRKLTFSVS